MNFLGIGPGELFFVIVLALIVLGPERLPGFARSLGKSIIRMRNWMNASPDAKVLLQLQQELQNEIDEIRSTLREVTDSVRVDLNAAANDINTATASANSALDDAASTTTRTLNDASRTIASRPPQPVQPVSGTPVEPEPLAPTTAAPLIGAASASDQALIDTIVAQTPPATVPNEGAAPPVETVPTPTVVARSTKPNWMSQPAVPTEVAPARAEDTSVAAVHVPAPIPTSDQSHQVQQDIAELKTEISRLKITQQTAPSSDSMLRVEVEQLSRDLKAIRTELAQAAAPAAAGSADTITMLRIEIGHLNNRIDALQADLRAATTRGEPSA